MWCDSSERRHHFLAFPLSAFTDPNCAAANIQTRRTHICRAAIPVGTVTVPAKDWASQPGRKRNEEQATHERCCRCHEKQVRPCEKPCSDDRWADHQRDEPSRAGNWHSLRMRRLNPAREQGRWELETGGKMANRLRQLWFRGGNQRWSPDQVDGATQVVGQGGQAELAAHVLEAAS